MIQIKKFSPTSHKVKAVVYGASGSGKTTFAGGAEKAIFASAEGGLLSIASRGVDYVEIKSLADLTSLRSYLATQPHGFETVVIDSITEINDIIKQEIEAKTGRAMQLQDWGTLQKRIVDVLRTFRDLPMNVLFIAQEKETSKNENGVSAKIVPNLNGDMADRIAYFMDIVGYIFITKQGEHKVITSSNPMYLTKDRTNLIGNDEEPNFQVWINKVKNMKVSDKEQVISSYTETPAQSGTSAPKTANSISKVIKDTILAKIGSMTTVEQLTDAKSKLSLATKLDEGDRFEVCTVIDEKLETLKTFTAEAKLDPTADVEETTTLAEEEKPVKKTKSK